MLKLIGGNTVGVFSPKFRDSRISFESNLVDTLTNMYILRKCGNLGEISPLMKTHGAHGLDCSIPGIRGSGTLPTKVERTSVKLSNTTKIVENGLCTSEYGGIKVDTFKIVGSRAINIDSRLRTTGDWHCSVLSQH